MADFKSPARDHKYSTTTRQMTLRSTQRSFNFKSPGLQQRN